MDQETTVSAVPLLQDALGRVPQAGHVIAQISTQEFDIVSELLSPARLGIYEVLRTVYAEYPQLDPLADVRSSPELLMAEVNAIDATGEIDERATGPMTFQLAQTFLDLGYQSLDRAAAAFASASEIEQQQQAEFKELCSKALHATQSTVRHLAQIIHGK